jgi:N-acetylmuramoyl-L-alanine amidase
MPDYKPNQFLRAFAVLALVAAVFVIVAIVATSGGGSGGGDDGKTRTQRIGKAGRQALRKGVWVVQPGDTLGAIALKTGIDQDRLEQLNPDLNPQVLSEGQRIQLRAEANAGQQVETTTTTTTKALSHRGQAAVSSGVWIVRSGDTLTKISDETGVDIDTLTQLNPGLNPETLSEGERIALR